MISPISPLAPHQLLTLLIQLAVLLTLGLCLGRLAIRFGMPAVVGELLAGVLLGPSLLGFLAPGAQHWLVPQQAEQMHLLDAVGQVGVLLLVGMAGLNMDARMMRRRGLTAARVSLGGLLIPLGSGIGIGYLLPASMIPGGHPRIVFALFLGVSMCVSSIPVIFKTLADLKLLHRDVGQLTLTAGMVDDAIGWLLLSIVAAMATVGLHGTRVTLSVVYLLGFVLLAGLVGRPLVRLAFRLAARSADSTPTIATAVIIILLGGVVTQSLEMEAVFGAFVAGILIGQRGVVDPRHLAPLRTIVLSVLGPIFLASAGLRMDLTVLREPAILLAALVVVAVAILGKFAGAYIGARTSGLSSWEGLALGAGMNARGVVGIVVAMAGLRLGLLDVKLFTVIALTAIITSLIASPLLRWAMSKVTDNAEELLRKADHDQAWGITAEAEAKPHTL